MNLPKMYHIRQKFDNTRVEDIRETVKLKLTRLSWSAVRPGERVAITAGSRGIANIAEILGAIVEFLKSLEADPFLFPAMGSHGGATAEGQVAMLAQLGVTEASVKAPIMSSMETAEIGRTEDDVPVFIDKNALAADHIVVVNRIKSHTKFKAPVESGLMKMMAISMGKQKGAELYHKAAVPMHFGSDREAIDVALGCIGLIPAAKSKIVRIKNTLCLDTVEVSEAYADTLPQRPDLEIISGPYRMEFNREKNLS